MDVNQAAFEKHLEDFRKGDVEALAAGYAPDAVMLTQHGPVIGREKIAGSFKMFFETVMPPATTDVSMHQQLIEGPYAFIQWSATTPTHQVPFGTDSFVFEDGMIVAHTVAAQIVPPIG